MRRTPTLKSTVQKWTYFQTQSEGGITVMHPSQRGERDFAVIGRPQPRPDGPEKVAGKTKFIADFHRPGGLFARLILSPHPHARITAVDAAAAAAKTGVAGVFVDEDLGSRGLLAAGTAVYAGQPVAVVVAESEEAAADAAEAVTIEYEPLAPVLDPESAMDPDSPLTRPDLTGGGIGDEGAHGDEAEGTAEVEKPPNVTEAVRFRRGDPSGAWQQQAHVILEDTYRIASVHQGYIEPYGTVAEPRDDGGVKVYGSTQGQFFLRAHVARRLGLANHRVTVEPVMVGGGFGGKMARLEPLAAALALELGRPVKIVLSRMEDFFVSRPGPGAIIHLKMAADGEGKIIGLESRLVFDSGAEPGSAIGVASTLMAGTYRIPNIDVTGYEVLTNKTPVGAYRAPGAPQAYFALESHMERLARKLGADPLQFRLNHAVRDGDPMADGRPWPKIGFTACLERLAEHPLYKEFKQAGKRSGSGAGLTDGVAAGTGGAVVSSGDIKSAGISRGGVSSAGGVAVSTGIAGPGWPGGGARRIKEGWGIAAGCWPGGTEPAAAACRMNGDGTLTLSVGTVDLTGSHGTFAMVAAEVLNMPAHMVNVVGGNTDYAPYAGMSSGSKTIYTVAPAVQEAAEQVRSQLVALAAEHLECAEADVELADGRAHVRGAPARWVGLGELAAKSERFGSSHPPVYGQGRAAVNKASPGFAVHLVKVAVDEDTGKVAPLEYVAVQDVGRALNPAEVAGQITGGVVQGIGRALTEHLIHDGNGQLVTNSFMDYSIPTAGEVPPIHVEMVEVPAPRGPFGAKGVGEPPVVPCAAALANAVADALGRHPVELPMTPEVVLRSAGLL